MSFDGLDFFLWRWKVNAGIREFNRQLELSFDTLSKLWTRRKLCKINYCYLFKNKLFLLSSIGPAKRFGIAGSRWYHGTWYNQWYNHPGIRRLRDWCLQSELHWLLGQGARSKQYGDFKRWLLKSSFVVSTPGSWGFHVQVRGVRGRPMWRGKFVGE